MKKIALCLGSAILFYIFIFVASWCFSKGWHLAYLDAPKVQLMVVNK